MSFNHIEGDVRMYYKDNEEDEINVSDDDDYNSCKQYATGQGDKIKIFIESYEEAGFKQVEEEREDIPSQSEEEKVDPSPQVSQEQYRKEFKENFSKLI